MISISTIATGLRVQTNNAASTRYPNRTKGEVVLEFVAGLLTLGIAAVAIAIYRRRSTDNNLAEFIKLAPKIVDALTVTSDTSCEPTITVNVQDGIDLQLTQVSGDVILTCENSCVTLKDTTLEHIRERLINDMLQNDHIYGDISREAYESEVGYIIQTTQNRINAVVKDFQSDLEKTHAQQYLLDHPRSRQVFVCDPGRGLQAAFSKRLSDLTPKQISDHTFERGDYTNNLCALLINQNYRSVTATPISLTLTQYIPDYFHIALKAGQPDTYIQISDNFKNDRTVDMLICFKYASASCDVGVRMTLTAAMVEKIGTGDFLGASNLGIETIEVTSFTSRDLLGRESPR